MTRLEEYGFSSNGQDERDTGKKFSIAKAPMDPDTLAMLKAREDALAEPRRRMDRAKYMFCEILDRASRSHGPGFIRKGSVAIPDSELARKFGVWPTTITTWKRQLIACGYVWVSLQYRSDRWPMTIYHIAALHPRPSSNTQNPDGTSNAGPGRSAPGKPGEPTGNFDEKGNPKVWAHGARKPGQKSLPLAQPHIPPVPWNQRKFVKNPRILAAIEAFARLSATDANGSQPQPAPADSHNGHRLTATADTGAQPQPAPADSHKSNGATAANGASLKRDLSKRKSPSESKGEGERPPDLEFAEWKSGLKGLFPSRLNAMRAELQANLGREHDAERRAFYKRRIEAIDEVRLGGKPPKPVAQPKPKPVEESKPLPPEERTRLRDSFKALKESLRR